MQILYTLNSGTPGGMEQHVLDLVEIIVENGHQAFVWCSTGVISDWYKKAGAVVKIFSIKTDIDPLYIYNLYKFLRAEKIDVVHAHELKAVVNTLIAAKLAGVKIRISNTHTPISEWQIRKLAKKLNVLFYSQVVNLLSTKEIALTESRKRVKVAEGIIEDKLEVIPNCVDYNHFDQDFITRLSYRKELLQEYNINSGAFVFGCVGRMTVEKGQDVLIRAFADFLNKIGNGQDVYLMLAGGGLRENELKQLSETLKIREKVIITGVFNAEGREKYFSAIDIFVLPSRAEGFGIVLLEAMASGLPCICSDLEVLQEVGGSTCMYFESENHLDLFDKMYFYFEKKSELGRLGEAAKIRVKELFTKENFSEKYLNLYSELLNGRNK
ncbi:hypothetical protein A3F07_00965 [candidate division WWE3 bacterium RIFCSPHIGHO2_12_FULL_38_15]|uniref:Glycosyltransferase subfamily 4-like N-terminal domain-containing protein n=1 Tax=candidate division WWE3 bacterium RIFCSPHIGHO2_02_FULL_38_14 TaxID=1802620 RepID=A0A1F4VAY9_UNCKA|nr:MAG: hypothetical protein A2793_03835 [candidate division WWE3 bacterium RIFCSPHIGHO2_01_FULL_38_45]OGC49145.1 MAG: hypothetical protein A3F07_00965 [candidate division WWE3 bacterium RIFCSPHIGHO2_12_FULL_38_15]OGC52589.1 MAG: hypothetical protein A3B64_03440 [candidate division WWE3 bacterium RIFCSPLOWO2_01_FULL_37_24]OGC54080.1 MAG: hypothetical protein A3D91_04965 [candidate division WWE3 bacterium RIFCSPHIGHO2_02_FULL_38_14]HLB51748.1 glycosyltransferase family 4 protein [Patescibacteria